MKEVLSLMRLRICLLLAFACMGCGAASRASQSVVQSHVAQQQSSTPRPSSGSPFLDKLVDAAIERTSHEVRYDQTYFKIDYPNGDVPSNVGVCTDEGI